MKHKFHKLILKITFWNLILILKKPILYSNQIEWKIVQNNFIYE